MLVEDKSMTDYTDIPDINKLYNEQQQVQAAIYNLERAGAIINMTIAPPTNLPPMTNPNPGEPTDPPPPMASMSVIIALNLPNPPDLIDSALTALKARDDAITQELANMGVVNTPVRR